jgi:phosphoglycerate dehydrogenase-like enzyme
VRILAHSRSLTQADAPDYVTAADFEILLTQSDVLCVLTTAGEGSQRLLGEREFGLMKKSAYLVNTARGIVIDEPAMCRALQERRIAGAALDTFVIEPLPMDSPLRRMDNVILTPHLVGQTRDIAASFLPAALENIRRILAGELPRYCKNPEIAPAWKAGRGAGAL